MSEFIKSTMIGSIIIFLLALGIVIVPKLMLWIIGIAVFIAASSVIGLIVKEAFEDWRD